MAAAFRIGVPADYTIESLSDLDLQPLATAPFFVATAAALSHNSFNALLLGRFEQLRALIKMIGVADGTTRSKNLGQNLLAFFERDSPQIVAVDVDEIEYVVQHGDVAAAADATSAASG